MFDDAIIWGSHEACKILQATGYASGIGHEPEGVCSYAGSYVSGITFWAVIALAVIVVLFFWLFFWSASRPVK